MFAFGNNFYSILYNRFVNFLSDCLSSSNLHIKFVFLFATVSQMHVFGKNLFYIFNMKLPYVLLFASVACVLCLMKLGYCNVAGFTFNELNLKFTNICCN